MGAEKKTMSLGRILRLYGISAKMDLAWLLRDTRIVLLVIVVDIVSGLSSAGSIFLLAFRFGGVGGMSEYEVLFMLGYVCLIQGCIYLFGSNNNIHISRVIGRGQMEHKLMQPLPVGLQLLTEGFTPFTSSGNFLLGIALLAVAVRKLELRVTWWWLLGLAGLVLFSLAVLACQSYLYSSAAFYAPVGAEEISSYVVDTGMELAQFPLAGMPLAVSVPLLTVFPAGLLGWYPSMILLGKGHDLGEATVPLVFVAAFFLLTQHLFRKGWNYYVKTGANRYLAHGHRN